MQQASDPASLLMEQQKRVFDQIRPACILLNDAARVFNDAEAISEFEAERLENTSLSPSRSPSSPSPSSDPFAAGSKLLVPLEEIDKKLKEIEADRSLVIDSSLGDYIFFPIDVVLTKRPRLPTRVARLIANIVSTLLRTAWKLALDGPLGLRLLGRLSQLIDDGGDERDSNGGRKSSQREVDEDVHIAVLVAFERIFTGFRAVKRDERDELFHDENLPFLGEAVFVTLNAVERGSTKEVQLAGLNALAVFCRTVPKGEMMVKHFLPGIVSSLTKVLSVGPKVDSSTSGAGRKGRVKTHFSVIVAGINILSDLLVYVLDDGSAANFWRADKKDPLQDRPWLGPVLPHVQNAVRNISTLRHHDRVEVRTSLGRLCVHLVENCRSVLVDSVDLLIETFVACMSGLSDGNGGGDTGETDVFDVVEPMKQLVAVDTDIQRRLKEVLYEWTQSIPTVVQHPDPAVRARAFRHIHFGLGLIVHAYCDISMISTAMRDNLVDAVDLELRRAGREKTGLIDLVGPVADLSVELVPKKQESLDDGDGRDVYGEPTDGGWETTPAVEPVIPFPPLFVRDESSSDVLVQLSSFLRGSSTASILLGQTGPLLAALDRAGHSTQTAALFLLLQVLRPQFSANAALGAFSFLDDMSESLAVLDDIYAFSVRVLTSAEGPSSSSSSSTLSPSTSGSWQLTALALEVVALQASQHGQDFRLELMDVLYPVLATIGSGSDPVRSHAMVCLRQMAASCGYDDVETMLVANADYLVNSIGTKLGLFETATNGTTAPAVMIVLVRLCGPSIVPFVADLVDSVFAGLEAHHSFPNVVEALFAVLDVVADEAEKTPTLTDRARPSLVPVGGEIDWTECVDRINRAGRGLDPDAVDDAALPVVQSESNTNDGVSTFTTAETAPRTGPFSRNKPFGLVLRIATLTQHYVSYSASPSFRRSVLGLLARSIPTVALHPDSFLPLVDTIWPVLLARLRNERDKFVVAAVLDVIAVFCVYAGDFMRGRITGVWDTIYRIATEVGPGELVGRWADVDGPMSNESAADLLVRLVSPSNDRTGVPQSSISDSPAVVSSRPHALGNEYKPMDMRILQTAVTGLVVAIVSCVGVDDLQFLRVVEWIGPVMDRHRAVRALLERRNGDVVWLSAGKGSAKAGPRPPPRLDGFEFAPVR